MKSGKVAAQRLLCPLCSCEGFGMKDTGRFSLQQQQSDSWSCWGCDRRIKKWAGNCRQRNMTWKLFIASHPVLSCGNDGNERPGTQKYDICHSVAVVDVVVVLRQAAGCCTLIHSQTKCMRCLGFSWKLYFNVLSLSANQSHSFGRPEKDLDRSPLKTWLKH